MLSAKYCEMELSTKAEKYSDSLKSSSLVKEYLYITAIDLGTIYSGYAYAKRDDIDFIHEKINITWRQPWNSGKPNFTSLKTPTCVLLDRNCNLISFGFDAENTFSKLVKDRQIENYFFFRRFKMNLYTKKITSDLQITDETGSKQLPAITVFSKSILALKQHFLEKMEKQDIHLNNWEIRWVITVPAIWSDAAKQFMRKSANEAGISNNQLLIALEPEAASIYCQLIKTKELADNHLTVTAAGTQYVVVDLGGGTADITVHEKMSNGYLKEIHRATGSESGGNAINEALVKEFIKVFGGPMMTEIKKEHPNVYFDVHREFEAAKKSFHPSSNETLSMRLPYQILNKLSKKNLDDSLKTAINIGPHCGGVRVEDDYVIIDPTLLREKLFQPTADAIIGLLKDIMEEVDSKTLKKFILVGGLSESQFIQETIRSAFPDKKVIVPEDASLSVVKGAVLFGHNPELISHRVVRYTYGTDVAPLFDESIHDEERKFEVNDEERCRDVFSVFIKAGSVVELTQKVTNTFTTLTKFQKSADVSIYVTTSDNPLYVDEEGCTKIGKLEVELPDPSDEYRDFEVSLVFGNTELQIQATDLKTGKQCETSLDFLFY